MKKLRLLIAGILGCLLLFGVGFYLTKGAGQNADQPTVKVGSKNFTESLVLGEAISQLLESKGYHVERSLNLGGTFIAHEALQKGDIDLYPEYTGTGLLDILKQEGVKEADAQKVLNDGYSKWGLEWLDISKGNNSQGLVVSRQAANKYGLKTYSDLAKHASQLRLATTAEFGGRKDGLPALKKTYGGFDFQSTQVIDTGLRYTSLEEGKADVSIAFTTDGQLTSDKFVLLEDDKHLYPTYYAAPVVRKDLLDKAPEIKQLLNDFSSKLTEKKLQEVNAKVDIEGKPYQEVAKDFLMANQLID